MYDPADFIMVASLRIYHSEATVPPTRGALKAKQDWVLKRGGVLEPLALTVIQEAASACSILQSQHTREETLLKCFACYFRVS
jgi:hypothetical protein